MYITQSIYGVLKFKVKKKLLFIRFIIYIYIERERVDAKYKKYIPFLRKKT